MRWFMFLMLWNLLWLYLSVGIGKLWDRLSLWKRFTSQNIGQSLRLRIGQNSMTWNKITGWQSCRQPFGLGKQVARHSDSIPNGIYCGWKSGDRSSDVGSLLEISINLGFCKSVNLYILDWIFILFRDDMGGYFNRSVEEDKFSRLSFSNEMSEFCVSGWMLLFFYWLSR